MARRAAGKRNDAAFGPGEITPTMRRASDERRNHALAGLYGSLCLTPFFHGFLAWRGAALAAAQENRTHDQPHHHRRGSATWPHSAC